MHQIANSKLKTHNSKLILWLGEEDSNPRKQVQSLSSYHWTIPQACPTAYALYPKPPHVSR